MSQNLKIWPIDISFRRGGGGQFCGHPLPTNLFLFFICLF